MRSNALARFVAVVVFTTSLVSLTDFAAFAGADAPKSYPLASIDHTPTARGQSITLKSNTPLNADKPNIAILSQPCFSHDAAAAGACKDGPPRSVNCFTTTDKSSCIAVIPLDLPLGTYLVRLFEAQPDVTADLTGSSSLDLIIARETNAAPVLLGITPMVTYPDQPAPGCKQPACLTLTGANFSLAGPDNRILWNGNQLDVNWGCVEQRVGNCPAAITGIVDQSGNRIKLSGIPIDTYRGTAKISMSVQDGSVTDPQTITISGVPRNWAYWIAGVVVLAIIAILWAILRTNSKRRVAGTPISRWTALMLDPETDTYSLSNFQFYLWTFAAVVGYVYLTAVRSFIQGRFEFSDVPANFPGLLAVSAGTWVAAAAVGVAVGPKGAGDVQPGWSDLLTVGGIVVPERVQFVVWTIVGVFTFLAMTLFADPGSLQQLPGVPERFLLLMGVSSAGYLGGKMVRKSGPVIATTVAHYEVESLGGKFQNKLTIDIIGQNLARNAGIRFGELKVPYVVKDARPTDSVLEFVTRDAAANDDNLASQLRLTIRDQSLIDEIAGMQDPKPTAPNAPGAPAAPPPPPAGGGAQQPAGQEKPNKTPEISVTNPDGQMAAWPVLIPNG